MEILVRGRNTTVEPAVDADSRRKITKLGRLASDIRRVEVEFSEAKNPRVAEALRCEVTIHLTRNFVKAHATAADARTALDRVVEKATHQLSRVHDKRVHRTRPRHPNGAGPDVRPDDPSEDPSDESD
jgi:ribosomal subunit interface protein